MRNVLFAVALLGAGCSTASPGEVAPSDERSLTPAVLASPEPPTSPDASMRDELPAPDSPLPRRASALAARLTESTRDLRVAIGAWRAGGGTAEWPPPREVVLLALDLQRIYQVLAGDDRRRQAAIAALPRSLRSVARAAAEAGSRVLDGLGDVTIDRPAEMRTRPPLPPETVRAYYDEASRRFGVPWTLLAAIHFMETKFGRVVSPSWAGAQGPMQFIPSTWAAYGLGGDVHDTRDAIHGAANYLSANGAPREPRRALWAYNPVGYYGDAVLLYERLMRRDERMFYALFNWQVFVKTRSGLVQMTGPGADVG